MAGVADRIMKLATRVAVMEAATRVKSGPRVAIQTMTVKSVAKALREAFGSAIERLHLVGSRLRHREARDLDFVAVAKNPEAGGRNLNFEIGTLKINLFLSASRDVEAHILEFGLGLDNIRWKQAAARKGFKLNRFGLWKGTKRVTGSMRKIAGILGMPLKPQLVWSLKHPF